MKTDIGATIKERRILLGLSLEDVAKELGVYRSTVLSWENGKTKTIKNAHIILLSKVLSLSVRELLGLEEPKGDPEIIKCRLEIEKDLKNIDDISTLFQIKAIVKTFKK